MNLKQDLLTGQLSIEDANLYYGGTFLQVKMARKPIQWCYINKFWRHDNGEDIWFKFFSVLDTQRELTSNIEKIQEIINPVFVPHYNFINGFAAYIQRLPKRTTKRAIGVENTKLIFPVADMIPKLYQKYLYIFNANKTGMYFEFFANAAKYYPIPLALEKLKQEQMYSVPLAPSWAISHSPIGRFSHVVYRKTKIIAGYNDGKLTPLSSLYKQELVDKFSPLGLI